MFKTEDINETIAVLQRGGHSYESALYDVHHLAVIGLENNLRYGQHQPTIDRLTHLIGYVEDLLATIKKES